VALRFGIVGCGMIGKIYAERLRALGQQVVAASDPDLGRAQAVATEGYADHREMFARSNLDVACICSPTQYHHRAVLDAAAAGIDVFLEKPMSVALAEAREMRAAMVSRRVGFGFKMRFESVFAAAHAAIEAGEIGAPRFGTFSFYQPIPPGERIWYADVGVLRDMLVHMFDMASWLMAGEPQQVSARTAREIGRAGEDKAFVDIMFSNGRQARVQGGYMPDYPDVAGHEDIVFQIVGERGYLVGKRPDTLMVVNHAGARAVPIAIVDAFGAELKAYIAAMETGSVLPISDTDGLRAQAVIDAAERSAAKGGALTGIANLEGR
jgi:myo-inositol 2-dehydrogenase/D-chiro-inositol 1-dehydrogenase